MIYWEQDGNKIYQGNVLEVLQGLEPESVHMIVTSPPYWGLRDYNLPPQIWDARSGKTSQICIGGNEHEWGELQEKHDVRKEKITAGKSRTTDRFYGDDPTRRFNGNHQKHTSGQFCIHCNAWRGSLGLEPTPELYIQHMVQVFREVKRVLRDDGTLWLNMGDSYATSNPVGRRDCGVGALREGRAEPAGSFTVNVRKFRPGAWAKGKVDERGQRNRNGAGAAPGCKPKDLIGVPWMLARALRDPYYTGKIKSEADRVWLAAIIDGEGCIFIHKRKAGQSNGQGYFRKNDTYSPGLEVANTHMSIIQRCMDITGIGSVCTVERETKHKNRNIPLHRWNVRSNQCREIIKEIYPYLVGKQHEARLLLGCPSSGPDADKAHVSLMALHNGKDAYIDFKPPESMYEPGWYLRSDIIWSKSNPMPESCTDRPTKAHEYLFLLTKNQRYFYDEEAIREDGPTYTRKAGGYNQNGQCRPDGVMPYRGGGFADKDTTTTGRNKRTVWTIATQPFPEAHFATFPEKLIEPCIFAGASEKGCCPECGSPWERVVEKTKEYHRKQGYKANSPMAQNKDDLTNFYPDMYNTISKTIGWKPGCKCYNTEPLLEYPKQLKNYESDEIYEARCEPYRIERLRLLELWKPLPVKPCTVCDPFGGSMTSAIVAHKYGRKFIMVELSKTYIDEIGIPRIEQEAKQLKLFP